MSTIFCCCSFSLLPAHPMSPFLGRPHPAVPPSPLPHSPEHVREDLVATLEELQVSYVDNFVLHWPQVERLEMALGVCAPHSCPARHEYEKDQLTSFAVSLIGLPRHWQVGPAGQARQRPRSRQQGCVRENGFWGNSLAALSFSLCAIERFALFTFLTHFPLSLFLPTLPSLLLYTLHFT